MEDGRATHRVTQRQLGAPETEPASPDPLDAPPETAGSSAPDSTGPATVVASDAALRDRQRIWWRERARFEASRRRAPDEPHE